MIVYVESVLIENLFVNGFLFSLTLFFLKSRINKKRLILCVVISSVVSCVLPFFMQYSSIIKIVCLLVIPFYLRKNKTFRTYLMTLSVFCVVTLSFGGMVYSLKLFFQRFCQAKINQLGLLSVLFSIAGIGGMVIVHELNRYQTILRTNENTYDVTIRCGNDTVTCNAFFDTGNKTYAKNGEPVTIVEYPVYNRFCLKDEGEIVVSTVAGYKRLRTKEAEIEIYSDDGVNTIYQTLIASAPGLTLKENVLLHGDAFGG